jgi:hypothetical protein
MNYLSNSKRYAASAAVLESIGTFKVLVCRHGKLSNTVKVRWVTWCSADGHVLVRHHFCPLSPLCLLKLPCIGRRWGSCYEIFFSFGCSLKVEQSASENWGQRAGLSSREIMYEVARAWREISMHCHNMLRDEYAVATAWVEISMHCLHIQYLGWVHCVLIPEHVSRMSTLHTHPWACWGSAYYAVAAIWLEMRRQDRIFIAMVMHCGEASVCLEMSMQWTVWV